MISIENITHPLTSCNREVIYAIEKDKENDTQQVIRNRFKQKQSKPINSSNYYADNVDPTWLVSVALEFLYGIKDSLMLKSAFELIWASKIIKSILCKTFLINGVLIVGSSFILKLFTKGLFSQSSSQSELTQTIFSVLYHLFYLYPLYLCSLVINSFDYMDMAAEALSLGRKKSRNKGPSADILTRIYNEVINALFLIFFLLQAFILSYIPYLGPILSLISQSFTYAFYCFTYKWGTDQADLYRILAFFDKHFFYFSGFGFIYAIVTRIFPGLVGSGVYAALFPVFLLLSIRAKPPKDFVLNDLGDLNYHLKMMQGAKEERRVVEYDDIDTFDYKGFCLSLKSQIGAFTFPLIGINFVGRFLGSKVQA